MPRKNASKKSVVTFDPLARKEYLTGFRKRKQERRKKAKEEMAVALKEERKKAREEAIKQAEKARDAADRRIPEIEHLLGPSKVDDFGSHKVEITELDLNSAPKTAQIAIKGKELKEVNKMTMKKLSKSKVFQAANAKASKVKVTGKKGKDQKKKNKKTAKSKRSKHFHPNKNI